MSKSPFSARTLFGSLQRWFGTQPAPRRPSSLGRRSRRFESLESRELLSITAGPEFRVNNVVGNAQQTYAESNRTVAQNADGRTVVVWSSFGQDQANTWGVISQIYNASGGLVGGNTIVNQTRDNDQRYPTVAMAENGNYVVTWTSNQGSAEGFDIYAQRYNSTGSALGTEFRVNTTTLGDQRYSRIAMNPDGSFVITWTSGADGSGDVFFQRYNASGVAQGSQTQVHSATTGDQSFSTLAVAEDGTFVVTWSGNQTGNYDIYYRRFSALGAPISAEARVNTTLIGNQTWSDVAVDPAGNFTVTWTSDGNADGDGTAVMTRLFTATGTAFTGEIIVNGFTTGNQGNSTIAVDASGNFVITWESNLEDTSGWGIFAQRFNFFGTKIGDPIAINQTTNLDQRFPTVASNADGNFIIVWSSFSTATDWDIQARRFTQIKPTARNDSASTPKNTPVTVNVLTNDTPPSGATLDPSSVIIVTPAGSGTASVNVNGSITYTPIVGFVGVDTFTYAVADNSGTYSDPATVTITVIGIPPVAVNDVATTPEDTPVAIPVLANDSDADGTLVPSTVTIVTQPLHGTVSVNLTTGVVTYSPTLNYNGADSFTYTVRDNENQLSNVATVSITITPVNDPPVANNDSAVTNRGEAVVINVLANDTDPDNAIDPSTVVIVTPPVNGTTSINPLTGAVTYTPNAGFSGINTFTYTVKDVLGLTSNVATVTIRVNNPPTAVNDSATTPEDVPVDINVLANDTDTDGTLNPASVTIVTGPLHGTVFVNLATGVVTYTPAENYFGADTFTYTVRDNDGALSNVATVTLNVLAVNDPPVAVDDPTATDIGVAVVIDVLANDFDVDGTIVPSTVTIITGPTNGTASINPVTGAITYTPNAGFVGGDLIVYTVMDNLGAVSNQAQVPIRVGLPSTIAGNVYLDLNNNGIKDAGESGLAGVSLTLLKTDGPITFVLNTTTAADGSYSFADLIPGTYTLVQSQPGVFLDGKETPAPGIVVGSIVNDQFRDIQLGSGVNAAGFNFGERGIRAEFLSSYLGARIFLASTTIQGLDIFGEPAAGLSLAAGEIWISLDRGWTGPLAFVADPSGGTAGLTLYDNNLNPVASAVPTSGTARLDYQGTAGTNYFLKVSGTSASVAVDAFDPTPAPVNVAPVLATIGNRTVQPGQTISFIAKATDANAAGTLTFALAGTIPAGASIHPTSGLFTWTAPAQFSQPVSFTILVQDNGSPVKSDFETFEISAGHVDPTPTPTMSATEARSFVTGLYVDLLGRNPDAGGLSSHMQRLLSGASQSTIVHAFTHSPEYVGRVVDGMYLSYLHRRADPVGRAAWVSAMVSGVSENEVATAFVTSVEYAARRATNSSFVDGLYRDILGRAPDAAGLNAHTASMQGGATRAQVAATFLSSTERIDRVITQQYGQLLGRSADNTGRQLYRSLLADTDSAIHELADSLLTSNEYLARAMRRFR